MMFLVLVCGGRTYADRDKLYAVLDELHQRNHFTHLLHGNAPGADSLAGSWARKTNRVQEVCCPANWDAHGHSAGYIRNRAMADLSPDLVVAFPGGRGTASMVGLAKDRAIPVHMV
jgi:hypothetical protein